MPASDVSPVAPESAMLRCPACGSPFSATVATIVSAEDGAARDALLSGRLNVFTCPSCRRTSRITVPLFYYDLKAELALVLMPSALGLTHADEERGIGQLTNRVVDALAPEQRRMYLLQPRTFVTEASFMEAVFAANGITPGDLEELRAGAELIDSLLGTASDDALRARLRDAGRADDSSLVALADAMAGDAAAAGDAERAAGLEALRDRLAHLVAPPTLSLDDLLDDLARAHAEDRLPDIVAAVRPILDYAFFSALSERIEASEAGAARRLSALRAALLQAVDAQDRQAAAAMDRAGDMLRAILAAADPVVALRSHAADIDEVFLFALRATIEQARQSAQHDLAMRCAALLEPALDVLEARLPARQRLLSRLARTDGALARSALLDADAALLDEALERDLRASAEQLRHAGASAPAAALVAAADEVSRRLRGSPGDHR